MKYFILVALLSISNFAFTQYAIIQADSVNVLSEANNKDEIIATLEKGEIIYVFKFENEGSYYLIEVEKDNAKITGYIKINQFDYLFMAFDYDAFYLKPEIIKSGISSKFQYGIFSVFISKKIFTENENNIEYKDNFVEKINGETPYGIDGNLPKFQYDEIIFLKGKEQIRIPKSTYDNLYEPSLELITILHDESTDTVYLKVDNSDAAGAYTVLWIFKNGIFERQLLTIPF